MRAIDSPHEITPRNMILREKFQNFQITSPCGAVASRSVSPQWGQVDFQLQQKSFAQKDFLNLNKSCRIRMGRVQNVQIYVYKCFRNQNKLISTRISLDPIFGQVWTGVLIYHMYRIA